MGVLLRGCAGKKRVKPGESGGSLRDIYVSLFESRGIMPGEVAKQIPFILFKMLDDLSSQNEDYGENMSEHEKMFYGL